MVHLTRPEGGDLGALHTCFNLKDTLKTTFFVGSSDGELVYADWIKPEVIIFPYLPERHFSCLLDCVDCVSLHSAMFVVCCSMVLFTAKISVKCSEDKGEMLLRSRSSALQIRVEC